MQRIDKLKDTAARLLNRAPARVFRALRDSAGNIVAIGSEDGAIWLVIQLWQGIGPIVGFPGLFVWMVSCYWLANRWDREADERFFEELKRRGWKPPPKTITEVRGRTLQWRQKGRLQTKSPPRSISPTPGR